MLESKIILQESRIKFLEDRCRRSNLILMEFGEPESNSKDLELITPNYFRQACALMSNLQTVSTQF